MQKEVRFVLDVLRKKEVEVDINKLDWYYILGFLRVNKISGIFYREICNLEMKISKQIEPILLQELQFQNYRVKYIRKWLTDVAYELNNSQINYVFLKGSILVNALIKKIRIYNDGERVSNSIDILVQPKDIGKVTKVLLGLGFVQGYWDKKNNCIKALTRQEKKERRMNRGETAPFIVETGNELVPYIKIDINFLVVFLPNRSENIIRDMIENRGEYEGVISEKMFGPNVEDLFIHLILHQYKKSIIYSMVERGKDLELYELIDITKMLDEKLVDLNKIRRKAKRLGIVEELDSVLRTIDILFETKFCKRKDINEVVKDPTNGKTYRWKEMLDTRISDYNRLSFLEEIL